MLILCVVRWENKQLTYISEYSLFKFIPVSHMIQIRIEEENMMQKSVILILFSTISTMFSDIFTFACGFYVLQLTGSGSLFGTYLSILAIIQVLTMPIFGNMID